MSAPTTESGATRAYYNEIDPYAAQWLRNLIEAGHIAPGDVDERSIVDVRPSDLEGYTQCHFFAGIGGWSYAARLAGWPDDRPLWTGSCPCQPYSVAGKGEGRADDRDLWPTLGALIRSCRPDVVMGEQVAAAVGKDWLDRVHADLEAIGYACGAAVVPACAVNAPHRRDRLWFVADATSADQRRYAGKSRSAPETCRGEAWATDGDASGRSCNPRGAWNNDSGIVADADQPSACPKRAERSGELGGAGCNPQDIALAHAFSPRWGQAGRDLASHQEAHGGWPRDRDGHGGPSYVAGADGKTRRVEPGIRLLAHGVPARVGKLRAYGNAIVPQVAAEVIGAFLDVERAAA